MPSVRLTFSPLTPTEVTWSGVPIVAGHKVDWTLTNSAYETQSISAPTNLQLTIKPANAAYASPFIQTTNWTSAGEGGYTQSNVNMNVQAWLDYIDNDPTAKVWVDVVDLGTDKLLARDTTVTSYASISRAGDVAEVAT